MQEACIYAVCSQQTRTRFKETMTGINLAMPPVLLDIPNFVLALHG